jgi:hypothetical protein
MKEFINIMLCSPALLWFTANLPLWASFVATFGLILVMHWLLYTAIPNLWRK